MELIEIAVGAETWKVKKLSQYHVTKLIGTGGKDLGDLHVDMILASVVEPKLKRDDVIKILEDDEKYFAVVTELERINEKGIRALGNYMQSSIRSQPKSETN